MRKLSDLGYAGSALYTWGIFGFVSLIIFNLGDILSIFYGVIIPLIYTVLYYKSPRRYYLVIFLLCLIEETLVFYLGGGLHGQAKTLIQDYVRSIPIFMTHAVLWHRYMSRYEYSDGEIFVMAGLHGFFWEIILSGAILNPLFLLLFGGTPFIFYGLLVLIPERPTGSEQLSLARKILLWIFYLIIEVLVGVFFAIIYP